MAKVVTRSDVIKLAERDGWSHERSALDESALLVPVRDIFTREGLRLSVSWNGTPFSQEPRFAFALLEGAAIPPTAIPNIVGRYRERAGSGACVIDVLSGRWRP